MKRDSAFPHHLSDWLYKVSTGWVTLAAVVLFLLFTALVLPGQAAEAETSTGGAASPDTSLFYTPDELYAMAEAYGPEGRRAYIRARFTFDLIWPLVYLIFLVTTISWIYRRAFGPDSLMQRANLVPIVGALFDYLENTATSLVMARYPARTPVIDLLAPVFTLVKWIFVGGSFVVLVLGFAVAIWRWASKRIHKTLE
ncbi:MAG: hypothetical protein ACP5JG_18145 [Anaerolineae bacterium]